MGRMGRALAALTIGCFLLLAPVAAADTPSAPSESVLAQQAPPGPDLQQQPDSGQSKPPNQQELVTGLAGVALIALVFLSRKVRKKPVLFVQWKKK